MRRVSDGYRQNPRQKLAVSNFLGIDLYNSPTNVSASRSPEAPNMIRDVPGKVRKRMGYHTVAEYPARINGVHRLFWKGASHELIHAGTALYCGENKLYDGAGDRRSKAWQIEDKLYFCDGVRFLRFDGESVSPVSDFAYVPTLVLSRSPSGGGKSFEGLNLLGSMWRESFLSAGKSATYQLSFNALADDFIEVRVMTGPEIWTTCERDVQYTFNAALGLVTFKPDHIPGASPVDGADNVVVTVKKENAEYRARIDSCDMSVLYGVGGAADRLFMTGCPDYPNYDWYSGMSDPTYFPVNSYCVMGLNTRIVAYSIIGEKLATHKNDDVDGRNIILREGVLTDGEAAFPTVGALQGAGTVSGHSVAYLKTEPLFFSSGGIYAITPSDTNGERYTQNRSYFINSALARETQPQESAAVSYRDFYMLALNGKVYVLDSLLKSYEEGAPYATHQYECFLLTGIDARVLYKKEDALRFGTRDGKIMEFYGDEKSPGSYNDNGAPIEAYWDTPMFSGENFYNRKGFKYLALKLAAASATGAEVYVRLKGLWQKLFEEFSRLRYFCFSELDFSRLNFSGDTTPKAFGKKLTLPKTDKAQFRFRNGNLNEPFGLYNYAIEFQQNGRIR